MRTMQRAPCSAPSRSSVRRNRGWKRRILVLAIRSATSFLVLVVLLSSLLVGPLAEAETSTSVTGLWLGTLSQQSGVSFAFLMDLTQDASGVVLGTTFIQATSQPGNVAEMSVSGQMSDGQLTFQEGKIVYQTAGTRWCLKSGQLVHSADGAALSGSAQGPTPTGCQAGPIHLTRTATGSAPVSGAWIGTLYQPNGPIRRQFDFSMSLIQDATGSVSGTSRISVIGQPVYFGVMPVKGQIDNGWLTFTESGIASQNPPSPSGWCIKSGQLTMSPDTRTLAGPWQAPGCQPGTISLTRSMRVYVPLLARNTNGLALTAR